MNEQGVVRSVLLWSIPFAVVVAVLGYETDWGRAMLPAEPTPAAGRGAPVAVALLPEYAIAGGVDARRETVERSLFNPTRRPAPPAVESAAGKSSMQHGQYTLTGTTVIGDVATAFLRDAKGGKSHTVRKGETLNGVTVAEVAADRVRLQQGDDFEDLQLKIASGPKSTVQVAQPAPVAPVPGAAPAPGGSGQVAIAPPRPVAPQNAINPAATAGANRAPSVSEILAERRRAARAAAQAAEGAQPGVRR